MTAFSWGISECWKTHRGRGGAPTNSCWLLLPVSGREQLNRCNHQPPHLISCSCFVSHTKLGRCTCNPKPAAGHLAVYKHAVVDHSSQSQHIYNMKEKPTFSDSAKGSIKSKCKKEVQGTTPQNTHTHNDDDDDISPYFGAPWCMHLNPLHSIQGAPSFGVPFLPRYTQLCYGT